MHYFPILKTTQAELAGIEFLSDDVKDNITPVFELTTSRRTKLLPEGDITRSYGKLLASYANRDFALDLTPHEDLQNSEIETFFSPYNGYQNWCSFLESLKNNRIIPTIQVDADEGLEHITAQVQRLSRIHYNNKVIFRVPLADPETADMLRLIVAGLTAPDKLTVIFDGGYIKPMLAQSFAAEVLKQQQICATISPSASFVVASSSFPRTVTMTGYGEDDFGQFNLEEARLHEVLAVPTSSVEWNYSDYGSIHPFRYPSRGGTFVPRVDVPLLKSMYYYRYRRSDGGYYKAATKALASTLYNPVNCWGKEQIEKTFRRERTGLSPSFWISVRVNIHVTTQVRRVKNLASLNNVMS